MLLIAKEERLAIEMLTEVSRMRLESETNEVMILASLQKLREVGTMTIEFLDTFLPFKRTVATLCRIVEVPKPFNS